MIVIKTMVNAQFERRFEIVEPVTDCQREVFMDWLLNLLPVQRFRGDQGVIIQIWKENWE